MEPVFRIIRVLKWIKRQPAFLTCRQLSTPCTIITVSDSAFRRECEKGLAMRGAVVGISTAQKETPAGRIHIVEWWARKQRRVTRSTFSAELNSLVDSVEFARVLALTLAEICSPQPCARTLRRLEETGQLQVKITAIIDAFSLYEALVAADTKVPSEGSLMMLLLSIKEAMRTGLLERLFWINTQDMLADGLGKGTPSREPLLNVGNLGKWRLMFAPKGFSEPVLTPIPEV